MKEEIAEKENEEEMEEEEEEKQECWKVKEWQTEKEEDEKERGEGEREGLFVVREEWVTMTKAVSPNRVERETLVCSQSLQKLMEECGESVCVREREKERERESGLRDFLFFQ